MLFSRSKAELINPDRALQGRDHYDFTVPSTHYVNGNPIQAPFPTTMQVAIFGLGCFWGAEEIFWAEPGVFSTAVGYEGGYTPHPSYEEVCSGLTGHTESVLVVFDPEKTSFARLVARFFEIHDPSQGMRQGNDVGTQYRSGIYYTTDEQREVAELAKKVYSERLTSMGYDPATTEIAPAGEFYYAEGYHQQYLAKNPGGYRCHSTTGVRFPFEKLGQYAS